MVAPTYIPLKGEMGPPKSSIYVQPHDGRPYLLAEWKGISWDIYESQWAAMATKYGIKDVTLSQFRDEVGKL